MRSGFGWLRPRPDRALRLRAAAEEELARLRQLIADPFRNQVFLRGHHLQRRGGPGHEFWQYREFQPGDPARTIDWRQSGRSDRILTRQKEKETQKKTTLWIENDADMHFGGEGQADRFDKYETAAIIALVIGLFNHEHHDLTTLSGAGAVTPDALTARLAAADFHAHADDLPGQELFLLGDFIEPLPGMASSFFDLIPPHRQVHLLQILDPLELDLPYSGRVLFEDNAAHSADALNVATIRDAYLGRLETHCREISAYCERRNWTYALVRCGDPLSATLSPLLGERTGT